MKLHYEPSSPYSRAVLIVAHEAGIAGKIAILTPGGVPPTTVHPGVTADNPLGKIPTLVTDHGHPIFDSRVIIEYLCHVSGNKTLIPDDGVKRFRVLTLQAIGQGVADAALAYRYETAVRPKELLWEAWKERQKRRILDCAADIEKHWSKDLEEITAGSLMIGCSYAYVGFRMPDIDWHKESPTLGRFMDSFAQRASVKAAPLPS